MNALEWLRTKATVSTTELMVVSDEEGESVGCKPGTYRIVRKHFIGTLPYRMAKELSRLHADLIKSESINEVVRLGGNGYRSEAGRCEFFRTTYELVA